MASGIVTGASEDEAAIRPAAAPLVLIGYNRPRHIERCIASLRANSMARETVLYAFLDGPRVREDVSLVEEVRRIVRAAQGFLEVRIIERQENLGLSRNVIDGVTTVLAEHESVIVVEDDLVVSPSFLPYMSEALLRYRFAAGVFSVSGYNYPRRILRVGRDYPYDAFFIMRHMCWGWGTWRDRWRKADWEITDYSQLSRSASWRRSFSQGGMDLPRMLEAQTRGQVDSWAIRWTYAHFVNHAVCLVPVESFVNNMGVDGSGTHMKATGRYFHPTLNEKTRLRLPRHVYVDPLIARMYMTAERRSLGFRAYHKLARTLQKISLDIVPGIAARRQAARSGLPHEPLRHPRVAEAVGTAEAAHFMRSPQAPPPGASAPTRRDGIEGTSPRSST